MTVTIQNDRDVLLQNAAARSTSTDRALILSSSAAVFKVSTAAVGTPSSITFTPSLINISGTVVYTTTAGVTVTSANNVATLNFSDMTAVSGSVTATLTLDTDVFTKTLTISKVTDGAVGANGTNGVRGNVNISAATTGSVWSDSEAAAALASAGYGAPQIKDIVALTNSAANFVGTRIYTGTSWTPLAAFFDGSLLVKGTVFADAIAVGAVTAASISVTSLAAISATIGTLRTASSGARTEIKDNVIKVFDSGGTVRVQIGDLTL